MKSCPETENLLNRALENDCPGEISAGDRQHLEQCEQCRLSFSKIEALETSLSSYPQAVVNHVLTKPILLADICSPPAARPASGFRALCLLFALAIILWFLSGKFFTDASRNANEEKPEIKLELTVPEDVVVRGQQNMKATGSNSFSAARAEIVKNKDIAINFTDAEFALVSSGVELISGKMEVEVSRVGCDFSVTTSNAVVTVKGTIFTVEIKTDKTSVVSVERGKVEIVNIRGEKAFLYSGESSIIAVDGSINKSLAPSAQSGLIRKDLKNEEETASAQQMLNE